MHAILVCIFLFFGLDEFAAEFKEESEVSKTGKTKQTDKGTYSFSIVWF